MGVFTLVGGLMRTFVQPNMQRVVEDVREGTLDFALTKPADAQVLVSVREVRFWQVTDVLVGVIVLIVALVQLTRDGRAGDGSPSSVLLVGRRGLDLLLLADARRRVVLAGADGRGAGAVRGLSTGRASIRSASIPAGCATA